MEKNIEWLFVFMFYSIEMDVFMVFINQQQ